MDQAIYAYPWDLLDDADAAGHLHRLGVGTVSLAAVYHTTRALTPHNPMRKVVHARHAAAYFAPTAAHYHGLRLQPPRPDWVGEDSFGRAAQRARNVGQRVNAWVVLNHASVHGRANPDLTVVNAFGDHLEHALCPAHPDVRDYVTAVVADLADRYLLDGIELEAWGYMGVDHGSHHDKVGVDLDPLHTLLFSVCFNPASQQAIDLAGGDPERIRDRIRTQLTAYFAGEIAPDPHHAQVRDRLVECLGGPDASALIEAREAVSVSLLDDILATLPANPPAVYVHASPHAHITGAAPGVRPPALRGRVQAAIRPMFGQSPREAADLITGFTAASGGGVPAIATLPLFGPGVSTPDDLDRLADAVLASGASGLRYYHYGLAPVPRLTWAADLVRRLGDTAPDPLERSARP